MLDFFIHFMYNLIIVKFTYLEFINIMQWSGDCDNN